LVVGGAFFFLVVLLALTMTDYLTRGWHTAARGTAGAGAYQSAPDDPQPRPVGQVPEADPGSEPQPSTPAAEP
jgi:hypothetical protein